MRNKIAVVLPIYFGNRIKEFRLALRSLLRQSLEVDIIVGCDGPIDPMINVYLNDLSRQYKNIYVYRLNFNMGLAQILNFCIKKCISLGYEYIGRMDGDDFSVKDRFLIQYSFLISNPAIQAVGCQLITFMDHTSARGYINFNTDNQNLFKNFIFKCPLPHPGTLFRSSFFSDISYSDKFYLNEDYYLWLQAFMKKKMLANTVDSLLYFRGDDDMYQRRVGFKVALSGLRVQISYLLYFKSFNYISFFYIVLLFVVKILPYPLIRVLISARVFLKGLMKQIRIKRVDSE